MAMTGKPLKTMTRMSGTPSMLSFPNMGWVRTKDSMMASSDRPPSE